MTGWKMTVEVEADSFASLKAAAIEVMRQVNAARSFRAMPVCAGVGGSGGVSYSFRVTYSCPIEERIEQLRKEADELERSLAAS